MTYRPSKRFVWLVTGAGILLGLSAVLTGYSLDMYGYRGEIIKWYAAGLPVAILAATFRYRLFDIDILIRKTLVYALLAGILALVYFGGVTLLQSLFASISKQQSTIRVVFSTLAIAALFNPLRGRLQDFIDLRFSRQGYDAQMISENISASARSQVELPNLITGLIQATQSSLKPESTSLRIKQQ